ncbi:50S ribosomal protein L37e [Candidatus Woesearchaeota archaeon]|nr:50S ribosomal protein L37e [Candidatus Woesearchaeota archaeon]
MTKGTPSMGKKSGKKNFIPCRRCGRKTYHVKKKKCASCGFGRSAKMRKYNWQNKRKRK